MIGESWSDCVWCGESLFLLLASVLQESEEAAVGIDNFRCSFAVFALEGLGTLRNAETPDMCGDRTLECVF